MVSPSSLMPGDVILSYVDTINDELHVFAPRLVVSVRSPEVTILTNTGISTYRNFYIWYKNIVVIDQRWQR